MNKLDPPETVRGIAKRLEDAGYETWCVGGAVRDALLGHPHLDWDLATAAKPPEVRKLFKRTVPVGVEFGTIGVLDHNNVMHEVTTFRRDVQTDGRHAVVEFGASLDEDLARRDYTINAIAYSPSRDDIRDPYEGRKDLDAKLIRAVGDAPDRMREDRLRALRAIRFAARFGFDIERDTWDAIVESAPELSRLSAERVRQEIEKTMEQVRFPSKAFAMWRDTGAFASLIPSLARITDRQLMPLDHLRRPIVPGRPARRSTRIAALFAAVPAATVRKTLKDLRFSNSDTEWIAIMVERWQQLGPAMTSALLKAEEAYATDPWGEQYPPSSVLRTWAASAGRTRLAPLLRLADAFWWAARQAGDPAPYKQTVASVYKRAISIAYRDPIALSDLAIDGTDLEKIDVHGPAVGTTLRKLLDAVINDPRMNTHDQLLKLAKSLNGSL
ncbi:MAG TPA: CCA tRNA nucleotidyltransferase [Gemmatimonadaceae bacterium]|jgi:tRNA nucleotidyltransferase (CCA-adding enzyme)|nr:CCA tRNA nucleotidyltransferase [Gemmatimonadaceae bacterium]